MTDRSTDPPFGDGKLQRLYRYWQGKRGAKPLPYRKNIDPTEMGAEVLPHVMLTEILEGGRFRYRLAGTAIEAVSGMSLAGRYLDEVLLPPYLEYLLGLYHEVIESRRALYTESLYPPTLKQTERYTKRLMMPLLSEEEAVSMVLSGQVFDAGEPASRGRVSQGPPSAFKETVRLAL